MSSRTVPVIALTGHLGAGKTTVLNHLLHRPGARVGVIVNDFGEINVDAGLITGQVDEAASIAGGCLCCMPDTDGLDVALEKLARPKLRLDAIIVEASGVAEPLALVNLIRSSASRRARFGGLIDVVDAAEHFATVDTGTMPPVRYAAASLVVVNKTDRLPPDRAPEILARIRERARLRNPGVHLLETTHGRIDPDLVFDVANARDAPDQLPIAELLRAADDAGDHVHADAVTVPLPHPVDAGALADLLEDPPGGVYRLKGDVLVRAGDAVRTCTINMVGPQLHLTEGGAAPAAPGLVAIGMRLDAEAVRARLERIAEAPEAGGAGESNGLPRLRRLRTLSA
ncbi:GTP-binding protein [Rothia sp. AR01]|uniref:GTP-binding protein n=1 Tax=Rothia santali TaxID=2949643 RepID=A0A9X2HGP2_9MICC|nr:GTP-binding protein [Rothia santali]MCP3426392.1 GTP-binding protein [Rothia santali]